MNTEIKNQTKFECLREIENIMRKSDLPDTYISSIDNVYEGDYYIKKYFMPFESYAIFEQYENLFNELYENLISNNIKYITYYSSFNKFFENDKCTFYFVLSITDEDI